MSRSAPLTLALPPLAHCRWQGGGCGSGGGGVLGCTVGTAPVTPQWDRMSECDLCGPAIDQIVGRLGRDLSGYVGTFRVAAWSR